MKREYLEEMGADELEGYARMLGIDFSQKRGAKARIDLIEQKRSRVAHIEVLGMGLDIPVKRLHDKNLTDMLNGEAVGDEEYFAMLEMLLGREQTAALVERCTDDDGTIDNEALGYAWSRIFTSDELKNF